MVDFPAGDPDIPTAALTGESLGTMHGGAGHPAATNRLLTNLKAIGAKLGYGTSLPGAVAGVLRRTASGQSAWGPLVNADVDAAAAIAYGKLALANQIVNADIAPTAGIAKVKLAALNIADADVVSGAAIHPSKLGGGGTGNRVVKTVDGTAMVMGQISDAEVASGAAISKAKLAALAIVDADVASGAGIAKAKQAALGIVDADVASGAAIGLAKLLHVGAGNVLKSNGSQNAPGQIADADVAAAALIALSKLAPGASGVLKSNGTAISAGNLIVNADITDNTINGAKILISTLDATKITPGTVRTEQIQDGGIITADLADGAITTAKLASRAATSYGYLPWTNTTVYGAGAYAYSGGGIGIFGLTPGVSIVVSMIACAMQSNTLTAIMNVGVGVDALTVNIANTSATCPLANSVVQMTCVAAHMATAASHTYYPLTYVNAGTHTMYSTQIHVIIVLHR